MNAERCSTSRSRWRRAGPAAIALGWAMLVCLRAADSAVPLPAGVQAVWDLAQAWRESTPTRGRICLNGLWRWQPAKASDTNVPAGGWGYFKVPGPWPGITDYMQKDAQAVFAHPLWQSTPLRDVTAAWYEREVAVPPDWSGRRVTLSPEYLNSLAVVFVDGRRVGELRFPAGELDLSEVCAPGSRHTLSLLVVALPLKGVLLSYTDSASAREIKGAVARRGLCGDVFLAGTPAGPRLESVRIATSVRHWSLAASVALTNLQPGAVYALAAQVRDGDRVVRALQSGSFSAQDAAAGRVTLRGDWQPDKLWDLHTPTNQYALTVTLADAQGRLLDTLPPERFGFREFWIDGRDFYLNGSRLFLSTVPLDNAQVSVLTAGYARARESFERLRGLGINFVYAHNYDCEPGAHLAFGEILRAADDTGMLVALTQPHFSHYDWASPEAESRNGYHAHAAFYAGVAANHPAVVAYATSHNATGYNEDMNPDLIDGRQDRRDSWALNNVKKALRAEALIQAVDPGRIVYHHASGNLGPLHAINFYPNFVPVQELSDWFEPWATKGVKPVMLCEYGAPFTWDWAMYRGWYQGRREFGSAVVPWEFCLAEWNAQFFGDRAFALSAAEQQNLRWEAAQFGAGRTWHRWDYPHQLGSTDFPEREPVFARYTADNWRAFRTWGVSVNSPWEHHVLFTLPPWVHRNVRENFGVDWAHLQRPGYSADFEAERFERMDLAYDRASWVPTAGAQALERNNRPLLGYLAGEPARFTSQDHLFAPGETVEKQLIVINNSRMHVACDCAWSLALPTPVTGSSRVAVETGEQARVPLRVALPADTPAGTYSLTARFEFSTGEVQDDTFRVTVLPRAPAVSSRSLALFDPKGETAALLKQLGVPFTPVAAAAEPGAGEVLVIGKGALTLDGPAPDLRHVREGLRVLVFEQTGEVMERRLGFRVAEYGLRQAFPRVADHPALAGLGAELLRDWRGAATLLPPRLKYETGSRFNGAPTVEWCGLPVTRAWRCGNQGNVASVLLEKPACGDFLPLVDGGFSLQYGPLLEYREGGGVVLFCQMDVTGRTESDPAAGRLAANLVSYLDKWQPPTRRSVTYFGDPAGLVHLQRAGFRVSEFAGGTLDLNELLVAGPVTEGGTRPSRAELEAYLEQGGRLLAFGWDQSTHDALLPPGVRFQVAEHINAVFDPPAAGSAFAGLGPADVHNRAPRSLPLVVGGATVLGDGVLARTADARVIFCALAPWQFDYAKNFGLKRTFRRTAFLTARLLGNQAADAETPLLARCAQPVRAGEPGRWLTGLYLDTPEEWDDPYRFFRW